MKLKNLTVKGFGAFKSETTFELLEKQLYLVTGRNGSGKSTFFIDALHYLFTGRPYSDKKAEDWINDECKECLVSATFDKGVIERVRNSNGGTTIRINGKVVHQAEVDAFVGLSKDLLCSSVLFGQGFKGFVFFKDSEKKDFITKIGLSFMDLYIDASEALLAEVNEELSATETLIMEMKQKWNETLQERKRLEALDKNIGNKEAVKKKLQELNHRVEDCLKVKRSKDEYIAKLTRLVESQSLKLSELADQIHQKTREKDTHVISRQGLKDSIQELTKNRRILLDSESCPFCATPLKGAQKHRSIAKLDKELMVLKTKYDEHKKAEALLCEEIDRMTAEREMILKQTKELSTAIDACSKDLSKLSAQIQAFRLEAEQLRTSNLSPYKVLINEKTAECLELSAKTEALRRRHKVLQLSIEATKELVTNLRRLKSELFNDILADLSLLADSYLKFLTEGKYGVRIESMVRATAKRITDRFTLTILHNDNEWSFDRLSSGEKNMVALACNVALIQSLAVYMAADFNFLVMDETFVNLDNVAKGKVVELLAKVKDDTGKSVILIAHDDYLLEDLSDMFTKLVVSNGTIH